MQHNTNYLLVKVFFEGLKYQYESIAAFFMLSMSPWGKVFCFAYRTDMLCNLECDYKGLEGHFPSSWISYVLALDDDSA